jgi:hypothetical protein
MTQWKPQVADGCAECMTKRGVPIISRNDAMETAASS